MRAQHKADAQEQCGVRHQLHHVGLLAVGDGLSRRPTAMEKREVITSRRGSQITGEEIGIGWTVLVVDRQRWVCDTTLRIAERLGARKKPRLHREGLPRMKDGLSRRPTAMATKQTAGHCVEWLKDAAVGEARNR